MAEVQKSCRRCGTCCRKGGPALHREDMELLRSGHIRPAQLITIRKGEAVLFPFRDQPQLNPEEFVKVAGGSGEWTCCFFNRQDASCRIYDRRPLECRLLQCWDTSPLEAIIGRDLLTREDLIPAGEPILQYIADHERTCSCQDLADLLSSLSLEAEQNNAIAKLTEMIRKDMACRGRILTEFNIPVALELFLFGRPLFTSLGAYGLSVHESDSEIFLEYYPV